MVQFDTNDSAVATVGVNFCDLGRRCGLVFGDKLGQSSVGFVPNYSAICRFKAMRTPFTNTCPLSRSS